ncbi:MAG: DUF547 domain-containing protein [Thermodesulfobacteriota bacterium]
MNIFATRSFALLALASVFSVTGRAIPAEIASHDILDGLLQRHVRDGLVNYSGFQREEALLDRYLAILETAAPDKMTRNDRYAFYINAYNAWTIKLILSKYPDIRSIKDLGGLFSSPWKKKICRLNGKLLTLDDIEHGILRPQFQDPRVHFAVICASKGCPAIRAEAYRGEILDRQLDSATEDFLNDPRKNHLKGDTLYVSKIFDWFEEDFQGDVPGFFLKYAGKELKAAIRQTGSRLRIAYLDYDWSLNKN